MSDSKVIEVNFDTNVNDWRRVLFWYRWKRLFIELVLVVVLGIPIFYFLGINLFDFEKNAITAFYFFLTISVLLILNFYFGIWRQAERLKQIAEPATAVFTEKGLKMTSSSSSSEKNWERFGNIFETQEDYIFFPMENIFFTIPKRFIGDENQSELKKLFRAKLGERAKLKN